MEEWAWDALGSSALCVLWYRALRGTTDGSERRLGWVLTLLSALVSLGGCAPLVLEGARRGWPPELLYANDRLSRVLVRFFVTYLCWDSLLALTDYPTVGGLTHHLPYLLFMGLSLWHSCPGMFVAFMPMELSTVFLASGIAWPQARNDLAFGLTFFLGRLVYHVWLWLRLYHTRASSPFLVWPFALLPYFIHLFWFFKWLRNYWRRTLAKKKGKD